MVSRLGGKFATAKQINKKRRIEEGIRLRDNVKEKENDDVDADANLDGRRIFEPALFAREMWCRGCDVPLSLRFVVSESRHGLASTFKVKCHQCLSIYEVNTSKAHLTNDTARKFDINCKAAVGMLDAGMGATHINAFLSALNLPTFNPKVLKKYERYVGAHIEIVARRTCEESIEVEKSVMLTDNNLRQPRTTVETTTSAAKTDLIVSYDAGWSKRGTGRSYDSLTGHASIIGYKSGKVLGYATKIKRCVRCEKGHAKDDHDCRLNFEGSAKSMEPAMAVDLIAHNQQLQDHDVRISTLIGDDDSSTIAAVRRESNHPVEKWSDLNHARKALSNALWATKGLQPAIGDYFRKMFGIAIKANQGDVEATRAAIVSIVPHAFDDHSSCGEWCGYHSDPEGYAHKGLPGGKGLTDDGLRKHLTSVFSRFARCADRLAPCGSSQANESLNNTIASKNPKSRHYGASDSFDFRVAAAVCQKNIGTSYVSVVNTQVGISPGKSTYRMLKDKARKARVLRARSIEFKRQRQIRKQQRTRRRLALDNREGITYSTECGLDDVAQLPDEEHPSGAVKTDHPTVVYFDLETSGFGRNAEICQIAARHKEHVFNVYIVPSKGIPGHVTTVTGLEATGGEMFLHGRKLTTTPPRSALIGFIDFMKALPGDKILTAHNCHKFDGPMIVKEVAREGLWESFSSVVTAFSDTLGIFKENFPERRKEKKSYKQTDLAQDFLGPNATEDAHNAIADVDVLQKLVDKANVREVDILRHTKSVLAVYKADEIAAKKARTKSTLSALTGIISAGMSNKLAAAGITLEMLKSTYATGGDNAVKLCLAEDVSGRPRVTKNKKIIDSLIKYLGENR